MSAKSLEMKFDPQTVKHLGVKMYSQLPAALAEIISNSYDAYATEVNITLKETDNIPSEISVFDNGIGLSFDEINSKFLIIGRNRRKHDQNGTEPPFARRPTGKKGLGKLALFGLATTITIRTVKDNLLNEFVLDYDDLINSVGAYKPNITVIDKKTTATSSTKVTLTNLKRKSAFDAEGLMDSLSRIFLLDNSFKIYVTDPTKNKKQITNKRKYKTIDTQFEWDISTDGFLDDAPDEYEGIGGKLFTALKPIAPSSGLRGITLYSRGKLVNLPEFFSESENAGAIIHHTNGDVVSSWPD